MHFTGIKTSPKILLLLRHKNVKLAWRLPTYSKVPSLRNNLFKLTHYDETKKRTHDSQIVRPKENFKLSNDWASYR